MPEIIFEPLPFEEAIEFFKDKLPLTKKQFASLAKEAKVKAFMLAGEQNLQLIERVKKRLEKALAEGTTFRDFKKEVGTLFDNLGITPINTYHLETVFRTNVQTAYQVGRYKQMTHPDVAAARPYWQYNAVDDAGSRPEHLAQNGKVYPADHSFWDEWYPPNGFNCRCTVTTLSPEEVEEENLEVIDAMPILHPDRGFVGNPGKDAGEIL